VRWGAKHLLRRILLIPFKMKGKALAGANIAVHSIEPAPVPTISLEANDDETDSYDQSLKWCYLDVTITPPQKSEAFTAWEPDELILVPLNFKANDIEKAFDSEACMIHNLKVFADCQFAEDEDCKYEGSQRLHLHIGVQPDKHELKFQYYFEQFGQITLPKFEWGTA
jgi:hypothetical protein